MYINPDFERNSLAHEQHIRAHFGAQGVKYFADLGAPASMTTLTWEDEGDITSLLEDGWGVFNVMLVEKKHIKDLVAEIEQILLDQVQHMQDAHHLASYIGVWNAPQTQHALVVVASSWDSLRVPLEQSFNFLQTDCHWIVAHSSDTSVSDFLYQLEIILQTEHVSGEVFSLMAHNHVYKDDNDIQTMDMIMTNCKHASSSNLLEVFNKWRAHTEKTQINELVTNKHLDTAKVCRSRKI